MKTQCCDQSLIHVVDPYYVCLNEDCDNYLGTTKVSLDFNKARKVVALFCFFCILMLTSNDFSGAVRNRDLPTGSENHMMLPVSVEQINSELSRLHIVCQNEVLAQIKIESGHLSSYLFKRTNNMLGMRYPARRPTTACGIFIPSMDTVITGDREMLKPFLSYENYAVYSDWKSGLEDYKLWQESYFKVREKYLEFLGKVYAGDSLYVAKVRMIANQMN